MSKIKDFLNATGEIKNGDRLIVVTGVIILTTIAEVLNYKLYKSRIECIVKDMENDLLKGDLDRIKKREDKVNYTGIKNI